MERLRRRCGRRAHSGASLVEFAIVAPVLIVLVIGGSAVLARMHVQSALEAAADHAAWVAARSGGDATQIQAAVQQMVPFVPPHDLQICARGQGYAQDVLVVVRYRGPLIARLPVFNAPLPDAIGIATGQSERVFQVGVCPSELSALDAPAGAPPAAPRYGPAADPRQRS